MSTKLREFILNNVHTRIDRFYFGMSGNIVMDAAMTKSSIPLFLLEKLSRNYAVREGVADLNVESVVRECEDEFKRNYHYRGMEEELQILSNLLGTKMTDTTIDDLLHVSMKYSKHINNQGDTAQRKLVLLAAAARRAGCAQG